MKLKPLITLLLLMFISISIVYLFIKETSKDSEFQPLANTVTTEQTSEAVSLTIPDSGHIVSLNQQVQHTENDSVTAEKTQSNISKRETQQHKIIAYYFHGNVRCVSCKTIEAYSKEAVETKFVKELQNGILEWRVVNLDEEANAHFIKDYQLYTKSLVIAEFANGKQIKWKNLEQVWDLLSSKEMFIVYVQEEIKNYLSQTTS